jgi:hypothetical protein
MNPLAVETALKAALAASAFPTTTIYCGTSYAEITPESLNLIVSVGQLDHSAGGLYKAQVNFKIISPALLGSSALSEMVAALNTLLAALSLGYMATNWATAAGTPTFGGLWLAGTKTSQDNHAWVAEVDVTLGVTE